jgi:hypothetical protein
MSDTEEETANTEQPWRAEIERVRRNDPTLTKLV